MKKLINLNAMSNLSKIALGTFVIAFAVLSFTNSEEEMVTICHLPPGNQANCQRITISVNALEAHLDHGDLIYCNNNNDFPHFLDLVHGQRDRILRGPIGE